MYSVWTYIFSQSHTVDHYQLIDYLFKYNYNAYGIEKDIVTITKSGSQEYRSRGHVREEYRKADPL